MTWLGIAGGAVLLLLAASIFKHSQFVTVWFPSAAKRPFNTVQ
jgi:hypothetical protein